MLGKWFGKRKPEVIEKSVHDDVDVVFNTMSDFEDVNMSRVDDAESYKLTGDLDLSEYSDDEVESRDQPERSGEKRDTLNITSIASLENQPVSALGPALAALIPLGIYISLLYLPHFDHSHMLIHGHFNVVTGVSVLAALIALVVGIAGAKLRNIQVTLLSLAFISLGIVFGLHGLTTPGFILQKNAVVEMAAPLSIILALIWLYLSSLSSNAPVIRSLARFHNVLVPAWTGLLLLMSTLFIFQPQLANFLPLNTNPLRFFAGFVALELAIMTGWNYWRAYVYTRSPLQLAIVYSSAWLAVSSIIMTTSYSWNTSWWIYHGLLLASVVSMIVGLVLHYNRGRSLALALISKSHRDPVERLEAAISPGVRNLIERTEEHDAYTAGHNHRVAVIAVQIGQQMGLPPHQLRALAQGSIVHDLGKLKIPSEILNKPGKLEADERALIETHPVLGCDIAKRVGFMPEELDIICHHHEHWDGSGYPKKLAQNDIPLLARIVAIADVYDALTSERSYRQPWSHEQARTHILGQAGVQFDPACVEAWDKLNQVALEDEEAEDLLTATLGAMA